MLFIVSKQPRAKLRGGYHIIVAVVEAETKAGALRFAETLPGFQTLPGDYSATQASKLQIAKPYLL